MRDPDLVVRAQMAASALEGAWHRWRVVYGHVTDPLPAVSSYVGYSLQEPWGQPRVVFGLAAEDAEQLAALLERHDRAEPAYAAVATQPVAHDLSARVPGRPAPLPVPRQAPSAPPDEPAGESLAERLLSGDLSGYDEPVYRQAAAAMKEAAAARELERLAKTGAEPSPSQLSPDDSDSAAEDGAGSASHSDQPDLTNLVSPAWMGSLAMAAFTARTEAEARIKARLTEPGDEPAEPSDFDAEGYDGIVAAEGRASDDGGAADGHGTGPSAGDAVGAGGGVDTDLEDVGDVRAEDDLIVDDAGERTQLPEIYATDVLEPLPEPEVPAAPAPSVDEPTEALSQDDQAGEPENGAARRGRVTRSYPIARLSKTKRPGASSQPAGS